MDLFVFSPATTSRAVLAFCEAEGLSPTVHQVDLMAGEHHRPPCSDKNPNRMVPFLDDDGFILTEAAAILRYLARKTGSRLYPEELRERARVDELMSWFEANLYKDLGFQLVYPQLMPHHRRGSDEATAATVRFGQEQTRRWLAVLDKHYLGHGGPYLLGEQPTIADYLGVSILSLGELVGCTFEEYANVRRWYRGVSTSPSWSAVNGPFMGFAESVRGQALVGLS
jgi:glutathione S-transferase